MFTKPRTNRISQTLNLLAIILSLLAIPSLPAGAQQPSQPSTAPRPELALQIGHRGFIYAVAIAPDNKTAASISYDGTLKLWDAQTGDLLRTIVIPKGESGDMPSTMRFSPDGKTITLPEATLDLQSGELKANAPALLCPDEASLVAAAPDGKTAVCKRIVSAEEIGHRVEFFWWNPQTTQRALITKENQWFNNPGFQFSPDGRMIAIYSGQYASNVVFWDVTTRQVKRHLKNVLFRGFSADGQTIVVQIESADRCACREDNKLPLSDKAKFGAVELWDTQLKAPKRTLIGREFFGYTPDGQTILLTKTTQTETTATMELWDAQLGKRKEKLPGNPSFFARPLYSPDGRMMALPSISRLASEGGREEIILYDLPAGKLIGRLPTGSISGAGDWRIAFSQDGATLTTLSWSNEAKLWDAHTGALKAEIKSPAQQSAESASQSSGADRSFSETSLQTIAFSTDGQTIASGAQSGTIRLWNFRTGRVIKTVVLPSNSSSPNFFVAGQTIIQAEPNLPPLVWDVRTLQPQPPPAAEKPRAESIETLSPNGRLSVKLSDDRKSATLYDAPTGKQLHTLDGHTSAISVVLFAPDNRTVATVSGFPALDGMLKTVLAMTALFAGDKKPEFDAELKKLTGDRTIKLWDTQTGQLKQTLQCDEVIHQARFLPDGGTFIATHSKATKSEDLMDATGVTAWDAQTGKAIRTINADALSSFLLSPDGSLAISGGGDNHKMKAWNTRTGELKWETSEVSRFDFSGYNSFTPDGKLLVALTKYEDSGQKLLDVQTGQVRWTLPSMCFESFSPDGQTLTCLGREGASLWDVGTRKLKWSITTTLITQIPFLAGGKLVALYGQHYAIELRDARDGKLLVSLLTMPGVGQANEKGEVTPEWIAFTPEGYYSASTGAARYIRWRVGDKLLPAESYAKEFNRADLVRNALNTK